MKAGDSRPRKGGRPPLEPGEARTEQVKIRLTPEELIQLRSAAALTCLPLATYVRQAALGLNPRPPAVPRANLIYVSELSRLGNNFNQLVKLIHQYRAPTGLAGVLERLLDLLTELKASLLGLNEKPAGGDGKER